MASKSLGTLTLDLIAKVGGFTGPLDKATRDAQRRMKELKKSVSSAASTMTSMGTAATGMAAAVAGGGAAVVAFTNNAAQGAKELTNMAALANTGVEEFQRWSYAAGSVGIEQEKLGDILKDVNDRVGDFITTGGGEMKDFFEQIAPKVGVTAEQFRKLSGAQGLQLYYDSLQKAGLGQQEITFYMESMADEATALAPLLAGNGKQLKALADEADNLGIVLSEIDVAMLGEFADQYDRITSIMGAMSDVVAAELAPYLSVLGDYLVEASDGSDGLAAALPGAIHDSIAALGPLLDKFQELQVVDKQFKLATANWDLAVSEFSEGAWRSMSGFFDNVIAGLNMVIQAYNALPGVEDIELLGSFTDSSWMDRQRQQLDDANAAVIAAQQELAEVLSRPPPSKGIDQYLADVKAKGDKLREEIRNRTRDAMTGYAGNSGEVGSGAGKRDGVNEAQEAYLKLLKELRTDEERLTDQLHERLAVLDAIKDITDEERDNVADRIAGAAFEDAPEFAGLAPEIGGPFGELGKIDDAQAEQEDWYARQLEMLEDFRAERADLNATWDSQELALKQQHEDQIAQIEKARQITQLAAAESTFGDLAGLTAVFAGEQSGAYRAMFAMQKAFSLASVIMSSTDAIGKAWASAPFPANIPAVAMTVAETGVLKAALGAVSMPSGMAHDGIDSIPEDGTWFLQKGERVTTAQTSDKLDRTLEQVRQGQQGGGSGPANVTVNLIEDRSRAGQVEQRQREDGSSEINAFVADIFGEGDRAQALQRVYGLQRQGI